MIKDVFCPFCRFYGEPDVTRISKKKENLSIDLFPLRK